MLVARRGAPAPLGHGVAPRAPERRAGEVCGARVGAPGDGVPLRRGYVGPAQGESREQVQAPTGPKTRSLLTGFLEVRKLLKSSADHWLAALVNVGVGSGARRGELLALTWANVDLEAGTITIAKSLEHPPRVCLSTKCVRRSIRWAMLRIFFGPNRMKSRERSCIHPSCQVFRPS